MYYKNKILDRLYTYLVDGRLCYSIHKKSDKEIVRFVSEINGMKKLFMFVTEFYRPTERKKGTGIKRRRVFDENFNRVNKDILAKIVIFIEKKLDEKLQSK